MSTYKLAEQFLSGLRSENSKEAIEILSTLLESLENKPDPESVEIHLVSQIYQFLEQYKLLENNIRSYVKNLRENLPGNKLSTLYENKKGDGTSILFD